ncbi:hypothetical protein IMZ31_24050 (plasmid) [Pontibacillus sp. ALD_SL1]|uniref:hypothetical protein n=1 Tax=Pontibacillus sp. ALD_SL1 TaxID=2777185 RepID=UPI001A975C8A|nr:hypothetical protein [Pontibacillus sp. ALD_SL1]QST02526.1 hypothetical protein IMZ31_24050 [Pontibacillus sp. ALD_SL1]
MYTSDQRILHSFYGRDVENLVLYEETASAYQNACLTLEMIEYEFSPDYKGDEDHPKGKERKEILERLEEQNREAELLHQTLEHVEPKILDSLKILELEPL